MPIFLAINKNDKIMHPESPFLPYCLALKLRSQISPDASNKLLNAHNFYRFPMQ